MNRPAAMVLVPTHDHASTLGCAVRSVFDQTVAALDVVIVGDGVGDDTRDVVAELRREDDRVRFVDAPKGESRNELIRHQVVGSASTPVITYLGDDDLLLPDHVEVVLSLLSTHDFAHPFPVVVDECGDVVAMPTDLSLEACVQWHAHARRNTVGLTGSAHTLDLYRRLPFGWRPAPAGRWSDHYMWEQIFAVPGVRLATGDRATFIKLGSDRRTGMGADERRVEIESWYDRSRRPSFRTWWDDAVNQAVRRVAVESYRRVDELADAMNAQNVTFTAQHASVMEQIEHERDVFARQRDEQIAEREMLRQQLHAQAVLFSQLTERVNRLQEERQAMTSTRTWRLRNRVLQNRMVSAVRTRIRTCS